MTFDREEYEWRWIVDRWGPIAYRTKKLIQRVMDRHSAGWHPYGRNRELRFERLIDFENGTWPFDREVIEVRFDHLGRLKGCQREKRIVIERGRSHADLCRMLGIDEVKR